MKPYTINAIAGAVLILMSGWSYLGSDSPSMTALIPGIFGVIFLALYGPFKKENKVVAHIIVLLTFLLLISLIKPLTGVLDRGDTVGLMRIIVMMVTCLIALIIYVQSFIQARKARG